LSIKITNIHEQIRAYRNIRCEIVGMMMKELSSKADGGDVKKAVEEVLAQ
jgi:Asp-tRNA(Asn)/Glu-tRNA(Gln) amidotransferase B subunit